MTLRDRAAQFCPFAALTGYEDAINETARLTDDRLDLAEDFRMGLDEKLMAIMAKHSEKPVVTITYFRPDEKKAGGSYEVAEGHICKLDLLERMIILDDKTRIRMDDVTAIEAAFL